MSKDTVKKVAGLARIAVEDETLEKTTKEFDGIMEWIEQLAEVDTDNVEPLANVVDITLALREDEVTDGDCAGKVLANAPEENMDYFVVPKVVE